MSEDGRGMVAALLKRQGLDVKGLLKTDPVKEEPQPYIDCTGHLQKQQLKRDPRHWELFTRLHTCKGKWISTNTIVEQENLINTILQRLNASTSGSQAINSGNEDELLGDGDENEDDIEEDDYDFFPNDV